MEEPLEKPIEIYNFGKLLLKFLRLYWKSIFLFLWPLVLLPVLLGSHVESGEEGAKFRCMYVVLIMAGYWMTECCSIFVTGLLPIFMFPLLNVASSDVVCSCYFKQMTMMFMSSLFLAEAIESSNLHVRIALLVVMAIGCEPRRLHFSIMFVTFFFSLWMMNTATAAMMCPIVKAIQMEMELQGIGSFYKPQTPEEIEEEVPPRPSSATIGYFLGVCYASNIGGVGTMIGTGTTMIYKGLLEERFPAAENVVEFAQWIEFAFPIMLLAQVLTWLWIQILFFGLFRPKSEANKYVMLAKERKDVAKAALKATYNNLGRVSWHESCVGILFLLTLFLWMFRKPDFIKNGWASVLVDSYHKNSSKFIDSSVPSIMVMFLMLVIPAHPNFIYSFSKNPEKRPKTNSVGLLTWKRIQKNISWGLLFLVGGGFSLARAGMDSGMSDFIGQEMNVLQEINKYIVMCLTTLFVSFMTELVANMATCNVVIPIVLAMSVSMHINPVLLGHTANMAASYCFMLPVGTATNAIIASYANIKTIDFMKGGSVVKLITYICTVGFFPTYGRLFWDIENYPSWGNVTLGAKNVTTP